MTAKAEREARLAAQLRANLKRRKVQALAAADPPPAEDEPTDPAATRGP